MCTQCDARISITAQECPYCSADLFEPPQEAGSSSLFTSQSLQTSLNSLYAPPYGSKPQTPPADPLKKSIESFKEAPKIPTASPAAIPEEKTEEKSIFGPVLMLSCASNFIVLGLLQCFFSENGKLSVEWDSSYWFIFCLLALPLFFFGYKKLDQSRT